LTRNTLRALPSLDERLEQQNMGLLLKKAAAASFTNISLIGCYMALFAVLLALLKESGLLDLLLYPLLYLGLPAGAAAALVSGLLEMSLGVEEAATAGLALTESLPAIAAILAWGGLSVQVQVTAMVADTDIDPGLYYICRGLHAVISYLTAKLWCARAVIPALSLPGSIIAGTGLWLASLKLLAFSLAALAALSFTCHMFKPRRRRLL
jgi:hypothetical protein